MHSGVAKRVAVFADPPSGEDFEFIRRGLPYENAAARQIRQLGDRLASRMSRKSPKSMEPKVKGRRFRDGADEQHLRSIVVVATKDHSRRLRRVLDRAMKGHPTQVTVASRALFDLRPRSMVGNARRRPDGNRRAAEALARLCRCTRCRFDVAAMPAAPDASVFPQPVPSRFSHALAWRRTLAGAVPP